MRLKGPPRLPIDFWGGRLNPEAQSALYADPYTILRLLEGFDLSRPWPQFLAQLSVAEAGLAPLRTDRDFNYRIKMAMEAYIRSVEGRRPRVPIGAADSLIASSS